MKFSFNLKKSVVAKTLVLLVIGLVAGFVIGQSSYSVPTSVSYHPLESISSTPSDQTSVDSNKNGYIDTSEDSWKTHGIDVDTDSDGVVDKSSTSDRLSGSDSSVNEGCVAHYTGVQGGGDSFQSYAILNIKKNPSSSANLCDDGDGCSYSVIAYKQSTASFNTLMGQSTGKTEYRFFQFNHPYFTSANFGLGKWIDDNGATGTNGDGVNGVIVNWAPGNTNSMQILDDSVGINGGENSRDQVTIWDRRADMSFIVTFCD
jgi:hypothetical protein